MSFYDNVRDIAGEEFRDKFDEFERYIREANNGTMDADAFIASNYARELAGMLLTAYRYGSDPMGEGCLSFYRGLGVDKTMIGSGYFERYALFTPSDMDAGRRYPLVISCHGRSNLIEVDEFSMPYPQLAGREKFICVVPQDTTPGRIRQIIDEICAGLPADGERVYMAGYSQGGQQVNAALFRMPELLAAAAPCGCDVWRELTRFSFLSRRTR